MSHSKKLINSELSSKCCRHRCALVLLRHCDRELSIASATEMPAVPSAARLFKSLPPHRRPQGTDIAAVAGWTVALSRAAAHTHWMQEAAVLSANDSPPCAAVEPIVNPRRGAAI